MLRSSIIHSEGITLNYNVTFGCVCTLARRTSIQQTALIFVQLA